MTVRSPLQTIVIRMERSMLAEIKTIAERESVSIAHVVRTLCKKQLIAEQLSSDK
jgi:predicted DNA-binding ribbon-helix-helix protein